MIREAARRRTARCSWTLKSLRGWGALALPTHFSHLQQTVSTTAATLKARQGVNLLFTLKLRNLSSISIN